METINGFVDHIIWESKENGYTVLELNTDDGELVLVGMLKGVNQGDSIEAEGEYVDHPIYNRQFKVSSWKATLPEDAASMERYLASGAIKGIGASLAGRIVKMFGNDTFRIMEEEPERLSEVKGISERMARMISDQVVEKKELREAFMFLQQYGISNTLAVKIYNTYGPMLYRIIQENPYKMAEDIDGVGFKAADEIAEKVGIRRDSDYRIRCAILYVLAQAGAQGHIYLPETLLLQRTAELLETDEDAVGPHIMNLAMDRKVIIKQKDGEEPAVFAASFYYAELNCARMLADLDVRMYQDTVPEGSGGSLKSRVETITRNEGLELDDFQEKAVLESIKNGVFILSGGPGTGKTTTINTMIHYFASERMDILLAAPTGRAAKRMTEATGYEARTIHRLLELSGAPMEESGSRNVHFERNEENPLEADVVIIDEMSMVDIFLFQALLKALVPGTRLILVGDMDQLPSVGPGQVLRDLLASEAFHSVILKRIFRQAGESDIVVNAHKINRGEMPQLHTKSKDFLFLERNDVNVIYKHMIQLITEKLPGYLHVPVEEIQVMTPMRKGSLGVETLNIILQKYLNPEAPGKKEHQSGDTLFREGDKVMQIKNNYDLEWEILGRHNIAIDKGMGIFNGDMGRIISINENVSMMTVEFDEHRQVNYQFSQLEELELAYAITVHKSQGSEYAGVVMPLLGGPKVLLNRNLLYTGVTRAKGLVMILGSRETVAAMIENADAGKRYTALADRIRELL